MMATVHSSERAYGFEESLGEFALDLVVRGLETYATGPV